MAEENEGRTTNAGGKLLRADREFLPHAREVLATLRTRFHSRVRRKAGCALALLLFSRVAIAWDAQGTELHPAATVAPPKANESPAQPASTTPMAEKIRAVAPNISYVGGQLRISVLDATLADVLTKVAEVTGAKLDIPAGASAERMPLVELGPGPARQILAAMLSESNFDYVIQASATDPEKMQSVLLMPRETNAGKSNGVDLAAARPTRSPYSRAAAATVVPDEAQVPESSIGAQPDTAAADANSSNPQPPPTQPDQSTPLPSAQPGQSNLTRPGALSPPATLSPQSMSQQLQQMYQQRMLMVQQERQIAQPATPSNPGNN